METVEPLILETPEVRLTARLTPWDTDCFGFRVAQVENFELLSSVPAAALAPLFSWFDRHAIRFASCRVPSSRLGESMLLESCGFRFIETALHPYASLSAFDAGEKHAFDIRQVVDEDIAEMEAIGASAFGHGRIHADPRLGPDLGNRRYGRWVRNCRTHLTQRLLKVLDEEDAVIALFVTEDRSDLSVYWHLTAIAPAYQGKGYGTRVWRAMLARHAEEGMRSVHTTITADNVNVLNLYSKLGFRFSASDMTFHWVRNVQ